ncbi:adenylate/guanylate cyclase domain-containing protein [Bdellovibrio svalbardensis]|uniref:Adenylate/guanylate cyclase domain-containing protein n=1 Tax=Bdellovibrio svalbardensis TaxID=2972972 RepID=A0ABT6DPQ0_9BACT|nr:adenylate/guanylate cyclase domain-containing protein [Bdellovibrio svalbardensis]MDG0817894.1 adenylate/guanylate cyclase domain-containing protein [Bdellovibrio svalbardensis]
MRIPISTKLITVTILILVASTGTITWISSKYFEKKASEQVDIANLESAAAKGKEVDNIISSLVDKARVSGSLLMKGANSSDDLEFNFSKDKNFIALEVLKLDGSSVESVARKVKEDVFKPFNLTGAYLINVRAWQKFPIRSVSQGSVEIKNASYPKAPAMITLGLPLIRDAQGKITHIVLADVALAPLEKPFSDPSERTQYLIDRQGELLAHKDEQKAISRLNMSSNPFVMKALAQKSPQFQTKFLDPDSEANYFGASVKTSFGVTVVSQTSEAAILEVSNEVKRRSIFVAGSAISMAIFFIFLFSMTLTSPIEKLADMIHLVSKGNFNVKARSQVRSHDEVGDLAEAFDQMTEGLKERDKVKSLFSKFHGSSVAEDLIGKDIGVGGQNKDVVVFFSDIRGFTAFSEKRSPEEVVEMLNEYFGVMVKVINSHGGVVDKFIGDAIMAVWGAPRSTDEDAHKALRACLEMRKNLAILNESRIARNQPPINIGMGLHAGKAISGTIGSDERMEYTVIGNTVNTASRIEASTKAFGADLLVTDSVIDKVGEAFKVELAGAAEVKGRSEAIKMYKVRAYREADGTYTEVKTAYSDYEAESADKVKIKDAA